MVNIHDIIDDIYEASVNPDAWSGVLSLLARVVDCDDATMLVYHADGWGDWRSTDSLVRLVTTFLESDVPRRTQTTQKLAKLQHPGFLAEHEVFTIQERSEDPLFSEIFRPLGIGDSAASGLAMANGDLLLFLVMRRAGRGDFRSGEAAQLDILRPHLARSAMLASRLRLQRYRAAAEALAIIGLPAAILSSSGQVLAANHLLQEMPGLITWLPQDRMALCDSDANVLLEQLIGITRRDSSAASRSFPVPSADGSAIHIGHVIPTPRKAQDIFDGASAVFVLTPTNVTAGPDLFLIQALFDLTPAEARVARAMAEGASIEDLAMRWAVSRETIRTQVKSVLSKMGVRRQAELVGRLGGLVRFPIER